MMRINVAERSWAEVMIALSPALLWALYGIVTILFNAEMHGFDIWREVIFGSMAACLLLFMHGMVVIGWLSDFPRWSYPYICCVVWITYYFHPWYLLPKFHAGKIQWAEFDPAIFIDLCIVVLVVAISILLTKSIYPVAKLFTNIVRDWSLLTFALLAVTPLLLTPSQGFLHEVNHIFWLRIFVIANASVCIACIIYLRSTNYWVKSLTLITGIVFTYAVVLGGKYFCNYCQDDPSHKFISLDEVLDHLNREYYLFETLQTGIIQVLFLIAPVLIGLLQHALRKTPSQPLTATKHNII